jgi:hypothetical protein
VEEGLGTLEQELAMIMECSVNSQKAGWNLDGFTLLQKLGEGAYSEVYLAL